MSAIISKTLQSRRTLLHAAIVATVIALGVNLLASWVVSNPLERSRYVLLLGCILIFVGISYLVVEVFKSRFQRTEFSAVLTLDPRTKMLVPVKCYSISEDIAEDLEAVFLENAALKVSWQREMFPEATKRETQSDAGEVLGDGGKPDGEESLEYYAIVKMTVEKSPEDKSKHKTLIELLEFVFFKYLSLHLSEHFDNGSHDEEGLSVLDRSSIPEMVLSNRILSMLTTPIEDRAIFTKSGFSLSPPEGELHAITASNGAKFERFELTLPKGTKITRPSPGVINLDHPRFRMKFEAVYDGFSSHVPTHFSRFYISDVLDDPAHRLVRISLETEIKRRALFLIDGWSYYEWIDSFTAYFQQKADFEGFLREINWTTVEAAMHANALLRRRRTARSRRANEAKSADAGGKVGPVDRAVQAAIR